MSARFPLPPTGHCDATPLQKHLSSLKILLCCIVDATNVCSLTYSSHRPPWCNTPLETSLQPRNPGVLHCWCNKRLLANLFLPHSTMMQHLSSNISPASKSYCVAFIDATNIRSLTYSSHRPPWCNTPLETSLQSWNPGVLHCWCNKHLLTNLFLPHSTVMQHLSSNISPALKSYCVASMMQQTSTC